MSSLQSTPRPMNRRQELAVFRGVGAEPRRVDDPLPGGREEMARYRLVAFSGLAHTSRGVLRSTVSLRSLPGWSLADMIDEGGEWSGIFQHEDRPDDHVVVNDPFGFGLVFYTWIAEQGGTLLTSNGFQGLMGALRDEGQEPRINWTVALMHLASTHTFFRQFATDETFADGVKTLRPGQLLHVTAEGVTVRHRDLFHGEWTPDDYDELLDRGIERAIKQLQHVAELPITDRRIYMSGGRDSRQMLALMNAAGVTSRFTFCSANYKTWPGDAYSKKVVRDDFAVANHLRRKYGLQWAEDQEFAGHPATFEETVQFWQSHRSNQSFVYSGTRNQFFPVDTRLEMRGGGGEAYRDFWSAKMPKYTWYPELKHGPDGFEHDLEVFYRNVVPAKLLRQADYDAGFQIFRNLLSAMTTVGIDEATDLHFTCFRERGHFGHGLQSLARNGMVVFPAAQPEWVIAGQFLSAEARKSGQICFDIIERVCPELNEVPFDSDQWSDELWARRPGGKPQLEEIDDGDTTCDDYWEKEDRSFQRRHNPTQQPRPDGQEVPEWGRLGMTRSRGRFDLESLRQADGSDALTPQLQSHLQQLVDSAAGASGTVLLKMESVLDVVVHRRLPTERVEYRLGTADVLPPVHGWTVNGARMATTDVLASVDVPPSDPMVHRITARAVPGGIQATASASYPGNPPLEYAFYLLKNGQPVHRVFYDGTGPTIVLPTEEPGEYAVRSFVRSARTRRLLFIKDSAAVNWPG